MERLEYYLTRNYGNRFEILPLHDAYGPAIDDDELEAIVVSPETKQVADKINKIRIKKGLRPLAVECISFVLAEDMVRISSTRIRKGEIDVFGKLISSLYENVV